MSLALGEITQEETILGLERREAMPTHFLLKLESFSLFGANGLHKYESGEFSAGGRKWRLILDLNEDDYVSVHLAISDAASKNPGNWEVNVLFSIFLLNHISGNYHYSLGRTRRFQAMKPEWGISKFISRKVVMDTSNGFIVDDKCVFGAEVFTVENTAVCESLLLKNGDDPFKIDWKISDFSGLGDCWTSDEFTVQGLNWQIEIYPKGQMSEKGRTQAIGIYLQLIDSKRVNASYSICIKNQINDQHVKYNSDFKWFEPCASWGWNRFMEVSILEDPEKGFIIKNCCHLEVEISVKAVV